MLPHEQTTLREVRRTSLSMPTRPLSVLCAVILALTTASHAATKSGAVSLSPATLSFYHQIVKTPSTPEAVTVTNNLSSSITIKSIKTSADFPFTSNCGTLGPHASCTVFITSNPQVLGQRTATLSVTDSADSNVLTLTLSGFGISSNASNPMYIGPTASCLSPSQRQQFTARLNGPETPAVNWYVGHIRGGNSSIGTITASGLYTAPASQGTQNIEAVSQNSPNSASATISITSSPLFALYPFTAEVPISGTQNFQAELCNAHDVAPVIWKVDGATGGNSSVGTITSAGVYTAPAVAGHHTISVTDSAVNKTSSGIITVFSSVAADFGSRSGGNAIAPRMFGYGRAESIHTSAHRTLLTNAGVTVARLYAQIPLVYATPTPNWSKVDPLISSVRAAGQKVMLQLAYSPPWLASHCGPSGNYLAAPSDMNKWGQIAASYVAHMDAAFPGVVEDYEIWNEPNTGSLCASNQLSAYQAIYAAAAPLMKQVNPAIRIGGPVIAGTSPSWIGGLLSNPATAPYVDFVSYHQYLFGTPYMDNQWDNNDVSLSLYQKTQDPNSGAAAPYRFVYGLVKAGKQPKGGATPIYLTEYNTNFTFAQDCCKNDPVYAPVWNALYVTDMLNTVYSGVPAVQKLVYFAGSAYPYFCLIGVRDPTMDCLYSGGSNPVPYPQYFPYQLMGSTSYLGLVNGGNMARSITPQTGSGGLAVTAFYTSGQDAIVITNPTAEAYSQLAVSFQNAGYSSPRGTHYQIVNGASISSTPIGLSQNGSTFTAHIDVPAYSVQAVSLKSQ